MTEPKKKRRKRKEHYIPQPPLHHNGSTPRANTLDEDGLTSREAMFISRLLIHGKKAQAAREAGYGGDLNKRQQELLKRPRINRVYQERLKERKEKYGATADRVMRELCAVALADVRQLFDEMGNLRDLRDLDDFTSAAVGGVEVEDIYEGHGADRVFVGRVRKYKFVPKDRVLLELAKRVLDVGDSRKDRLQEIVNAIQNSPTE